MSDSRKIWVIDSSSPMWPPPEPTAGKSGRSSRGRTRPPERKNSSPVERRPRRPLLFFVLAYLAGPLAPLLMRGGRGSRFWSFLSLLWVLGGAVALWQASLLSQAIRYGSHSLPLVLAAAAGWLLAAAMCWAWGVARAGRHLEGGEPLPGWLRSPGSVGGVGTIAPGAGLVLAGHPWRGGAVVAGFGPLAVGLLLVLLGPHLWRMQQTGGGKVLTGATLEWILIASAGVVGLGVILWLVQILDGVRLSSPRLRPRSSHSDLLAMVLLLALAAAPWFLRPSRLAGSAEGWADVLEGEGMQLTPLLLVKGAAWIDPGDPLHTLHAARLHEALGQEEAAHALREDLRYSWERVALAVRPPTEPAPDGLRPEGTLLPLPIQEPQRLASPPP